MKIQSIQPWHYAFFLMVVFHLSACENEPQPPVEQNIQGEFFLQSIEQVEAAGAALQKQGLTQHEINQAMQQMDMGLRQAFQVETAFLNRLDKQLARYYADFFINGVEKYRIGVESSNRQTQEQGLKLLGLWGRYWTTKKNVIRQKLERLIMIKQIKSN